ncbi:hypothetical protein FRB98_007346 [Tulasnella sp. 332]|nr:hypothetical protein FRB98_007346 [Tulasnella sp. 332]
MSDNNSRYHFTSTQDWFSGHIPTWKTLIPLVSSPAPRALEIGSWEGRSAVFLLEHLCSKAGSIVCIDHFDLMKTPEGRERHDKVMHNLTATGRPFRILDNFSVPALFTVLNEEISSPEPGFDWIYIDESHDADDTFLDGELAWRLARNGAIKNEPETSRHHPKRGVDGFLALHVGEYELLSGLKEGEYQLIIRKTTEMRIGFISKDSAKGDLSKALGYGMNVALTIDTSYAVPAAVVIYGLLRFNPGRITIYIVDCGLSDGDKQKLRYSIRDRTDVTVVFLALPKDSLSESLGPVWSKIDMMKVVPVERVLYLDADILIRGNLDELWNVDLEDKPLAAVVDIGHPLGHPRLPKRDSSPYFNAGVLVMNLTKIRERLEDLNTLAKSMRDAHYRDQDVLNTHFPATDWKQLSLRWNAQGLGSYALSVTPERQSLKMKEQDDPAIVHFTGSLHPSLGHVLNPWVQPYTSKPWGYAGAPGHPYADEWWETVERTAWNGWRTSEAHLKTCEEAKGRVIEAALRALDDKIKTAKGV